MNVNTTSAFLSKDVWCWWLTGTLSGLWNCTDVFKTFFQNWKNTTFYVFLIVAPFSRTLIRSLGDAAIATSSVATRCALRQAMKLGIPVIARNNAAYSAIIEHRSNGLLFAVPDVRMNNVGVRFLFTITTKTTNSSFAICYLIVSALTLTSTPAKCTWDTNLPYDTILSLQFFIPAICHRPIYQSSNHRPCPDFA